MLVLSFLPVALLLTITPGAATALVVRHAVVRGRRDAWHATLGNAAGVLAWAVLAAAGVAAVVAASAEAFMVVKIVGAVTLLVLGVQSIRHGRARPAASRATRPGSAFRQGLVTSMANPKLAVFFVALFPQFVPDGAPVLPSALLMAATIVALDLVWYSALAYTVARARRSFMDGPWLGRFQQMSGAVLIGLGLRLAAEQR
ncbi:Leucine efflux protein [Baekduia alba]|uniref:LysE family translocator n=1 Tax=Baekduia alba TaxID=2997333 RepID=UPI00234231F7|nr:LysE family translocator [Baekduia alba]WCB96729.1 Leucine efflux protein [Baekduia alba]